MLKEQQHKELIVYFQNLIKTFTSSRKKQVNNLVNIFAKKFFTAPASTQYHNAFPGGLLKHSIEVADNLVKLANSMCKGVYSAESLMFTGLFHDFGKVGNEQSDFYIINPNERARIYSPYIINKDLKPFLIVEHRTLWLLQQYKVDISIEEYQAILLQNGQYVENNIPYKFKEEQLAMLLNCADIFSANKLPEKYDEKSTTSTSP